MVFHVTLKKKQVWKLRDILKCDISRTETK